MSKQSFTFNEPVFSFKQDNKQLQTLQKFLKEMPKRVKAAANMLTYESAQYLLEHVKQHAPKEIYGIEDYIKQLTLKRVVDELPAYIVTLDGMQDGTLQEHEVDNTVLSFTSGKTQEGKVLVKYSPWPSRSVPYEPQEDVKAHIKKVSPIEIEKLEKKLFDNWDNIKRDLSGTDIELTDRPIGYVGKQVIRDVVFQVMRIEHGIGDISKPHWKPAVEEMKKAMPRLMKTIERTLTDPSFPCTKTIEAVDEFDGDVKKVEKFMDKI